MPQQQILGRGKCYFDPFAAGTFNVTGEKYFGNTPSLDIAIATTALDHYDSDEGMKVKDITVTLQQDFTTTLQCDNISMDNLAFFFASNTGKQSTTQAAGTSPVSETIMMSAGSWYQLGVTPQNIAGVVAVSDFTAESGSGTPTPIDIAANFDLDLANGRVGVKENAPAFTAGPVAVTAGYKLAAATFDTVLSGDAQIMGAFRFISKNGYGPQRNYFMPYVKITADGNFQLKGDAWQQMQFKLEVLKKDSLTERVYLNGRAI